MKPGDRVAHLEVRELIDEGGMGAVYRAFDQRLEREVALKVLHSLRMDGETRARLLQEARILSQLQHPNICQIFDYLERDEGDCLVLELISGRTLGEAIREGLGERRKLEIARQIAATLAVTHARGIIHRDLKPANIMLTEDGAVKILDFGLARTPTAHDRKGIEPGSWASHPDSRTGGANERSPLRSSGYYRTEHGQVLGTASAMSPEQARGEPITSASDMYSFGLLLQELFTGEPAYEKDLPVGVLLAKAAEGDIRPFSGLDAELSRLIRELESLAPEERPTAVQASGRLAWMLGRPRRRASWALATLLVLVILFGATRYTLDLRYERNAAEEARRAAEQARAEAEEVAAFLTNLFEVSDPGEARGEVITARQLLDRGAVEIRQELASQPATQARLMGVIGRINHRLGALDEATTLLEEALAIRRETLPEDHPDLATGLHELGAIYRDRGRMEEGEALLLEAVAIRERALGPTHPDLASTLNELAVLHGMLGRLDETEPLLRRVLSIYEETLGEQNPRVAAVLNNLGIVHGIRSEYAAAEGYFLRGLAIREKVLPPDHPDLAANLVAIGTNYANQGQHEEAVEYYSRGHEIWRKAFGPDHPRLGLVLTNLGSSYRQLGRDERAETHLLEALELRRRALGPSHPDVAKTLIALGELARDRQRLGEAESYYRRALEIRRSAEIPNVEDLRLVLRLLAGLVREQGRDEEATALEDAAASL